jgi:AcrR family transcriptional regulator
MGEIARAARVSKGTLYVYFKDKDELFKAIAAKECVFQAEGIFSFDTADPDVEAVLMRVFTGFVKALCEPGRHSSLRTVIAIADRMPEVGQRSRPGGSSFQIARSPRRS